MTDPPCNCLATGTGTLIAGKRTVTDLSLEVLRPEPARGRDQAAAKARVPALHIWPRRPSRLERWLEYWLWYYDNPKKFLGQGRHQGDWEMVIVEVGNDGTPRSVTCSQHSAGEARRWNAVAKRDGHPLVYVAPFSHANYFEPGTHFYFPGADHPTTKGPCRLPEVAEFGDWQEWRGRWGATLGPLRGRLNIGGTSPMAPIAQAQRWARPYAYHAAAVVRKPVAWFFRALWFLGKATFPLVPKLSRTTLEGTKVTVDYELPQRGLHRGQHLLLTVHSADDTEEVLLSQAFEDAERSRSVALELPRAPQGGCRVFASAFNLLGQRSNPVDIAAGSAVLNAT